MPTTDPRIDAYIEKSQDFAKPILKHLRALVHKACPGVEETMKWSFPNYSYKGAILCNMASFKQHCAFGFWKASLMKDPQGLFNKDGHNSMGQFDRITSVKDLPADKILIAYIREAATLNEDGVKVVKKKSAVPQVTETPDDLLAALKKNKKAQATFDAFSPSNKKEYILWITEAKTEATRTKRLETAIEWMSEGKARNWKYERC
ncbi:MAG TPA: YdeI/OmpD-associated family protein [Panacibacter sp.]|nr:YdeI/OmpD-associated family protein [Panacibacter sp.]HNP46671.1 YdeI/OmpD-associated family protein [Panacibacter sp.]